jgi:hemerythrin-like domain-containing protein
MANMKATKLLEQDHKAVKNLFSKFEKAGEKAYKVKKQIFDQIKQDLEIHAQIEEEIFYPAVRGTEDSDAQDLIAEALEEHEGIKALLEEISDMEPDDTEYDSKVADLREEVEHHVEEEQSEIFEVAEDQLGNRLEELGEELEERKEALRNGGSKTRPPPQRGAMR